MLRLIWVDAIVIMAIGGLIGWLPKSGPLAQTFARDKEAKAPDTPASFGDASMLPFPPEPPADPLK